MTRTELREKIKDTVKSIIATEKKVERDAAEYDELTKFPELKTILVDLLTAQFADFIDGIDWVAPRPTTFRINLKNEEFFYLIYTERSWIAKIEGKKYYLVNLDEEERAAIAIARVLSYGEKVTETAEGSPGSPPSSLGGGGGSALGGGAAPDTGGDEPEPTDEPAGEPEDTE